jgi:hypothetical protein
MQAKNFKNVYKNLDIKLDGGIFDSCTFTNCNLIFEGLSPFSLSNNNFDNCRWVFQGPAKITLNMLRGLYHGGGQAVVEEIFNNMKAV